MRHRDLFASFFIASFWVCTSYCQSQQQPQLLDKDDQYRISEILRDARDEVRKHYYDPKLNGLPWDERYQQYAAMIPSARNLGEGFRVVAAFLSGLQDSHVYFIPPSRMNRYEDGYRFELVGNDGFITHIRPSTDAQQKLHTGDQIVTIDGYNVNRDDFHDLSYFLHVLSPMPAAQIVVRSPQGDVHTVVVNHSIKQGKLDVDLTDSGDFYDLVRREQSQSHTSRSRIAESGDIAIWKLRQFDLDANEVGHFIGIARKHSTLILDLRGNSGGSVETLKEIVGSLFEKDIKICDQVERKGKKELIAKHRGGSFSGKLIVLVDAGSASASELLARVVQIEHRGIVIGDQSAGAVMEARIYSESRGADEKFFYDFSVTDANLIMTDGKSLEKTGVLPDERVVPSGAEIADGRDPVLSRAAELAGAHLDPSAAGKMFPFEWAPI